MRRTAIHVLAILAALAMPATPAGQRPDPGKRTAPVTDLRETDHGPRRLALTEPMTLEGVLVDGGCQDRAGLTRARQSEAACGLTRATRGFSLLTSDGRLFDLDEGGNTLAMQALLYSPAGRAVLAGEGGPIKPPVRAHGLLRANRLLVDQIRVLP